MSPTDVLERRLFVRRNKSIGGDLMMSYAADSEQMGWLGKGEQPITAPLRRPKILTDHQHLKCQTDSNPYSNSHFRDGQSQSLRAGFKPGFESCQAGKKSFHQVKWNPQVKALSSCRTENPARKWSSRIGLSRPFSRTDQRKKLKTFFRRLCYFVDNVLLYSWVAERSSCLFIIWPHAQPEAVEVHRRWSWGSCPNSSCHSLRWPWSAASVQTPRIKTQTNQRLRRPFSPCSAATSKTKAWAPAQQMPFINVNEACGL